MPSTKFELNGPTSGRFRIGCTIHCGVRDCSRLAKPNAQQVSVGLTTSPTRNASAWPHRDLVAGVKCERPDFSFPPRVAHLVVIVVAIHEVAEARMVAAGGAPRGI